MEQNKNVRNITVKYTSEQKAQMKNLSKKYDDLYNKYNKISSCISFILSAMELCLLSITVGFLFYLSYTSSGYSKQFITECCITIIGILSVLMIIYFVKTYFIDNKCSEYAWYSNVIYATIVRQMEYIENQKENQTFILREDKLYYRQGWHDFVTLSGNIPDGNILVSVRPYGNAHAWTASETQ